VTKLCKVRRIFVVGAGEAETTLEVDEEVAVEEVAEAVATERREQSLPLVMKKWARSLSANMNVTAEPDEERKYPEVVAVLTGLAMYTRKLWKVRKTRSLFLKRVVRSW
jgi:hypothetical protein